MIDATPRHDAEPQAGPDLPVRGAVPAGENATRPSTTRAASAGDEQPVTPDVSQDDTDHGWGDDLRDPRGGRDEDWYRRERPPHWE